MNTFLNQTGFETIDLVAVLVFILAGAGFEYAVGRSLLKRESLSGHMNLYRRVWMNNMLRRDPKMVDGLIQNSLQQGVLFFASSSILLVGALMTGLGSSEKALKVLNDLPLSTGTTRTEWELKILFLVLIFVYAFFKFAWSYRLFNYVTILIGAAPDMSRADTAYDEEALSAHAERLAQLHSLAARHFTAGINAYFQALAAIAWFINGWLFLIATVWVMAVLYRRAFRSRSRTILMSSPMRPE